MESEAKPLEDWKANENLAEGKLVYNFSPGPCILPRAILDRAAADMVNYKGTNQSVMELSHRKPEFLAIDKDCKDQIRRLLNVPDDYSVLLNQGGATNQYTAVIQNLIGLKPGKKAMYCTTGLWSTQCIAEARRHHPDGVVEVLNNSSSNHTKMQDPSTWNIDPSASFLHICINETVHGFKISEDNFPWDKFPEDMVIVGDMSSCIGTEAINWKRFSVVYAGVQKNLGPTGCTVMIVKNSLLGHAEPNCPIMCDWTTFQNSPGTYYNTPPCWCIYMTGLNVGYLNQTGGLAHYDQLCDQRAQQLWEVVDQSNGFYNCATDPAFRSRVNVIFRIKDADKDLEAKFIAEADARKMINTAGHPANPGIRISMYNAMPVEGVRVLCAFMREFQAANQ